MARTEPLASLWLARDGRRRHARLGTGRLRSDRPLVVLVHGLVVSGRYMEPLAEALAPRVPVLVPDLPGFGRSRGGPLLDLDGLADSLVEWLDALEVERAAFVGNSMGCQVVTALAARHPDRVSCVVLQGPSGDLTRSLPRLVAALLREGLKLLPTGLPFTFLRDLWDCGPGRALATLRLMRRDAGHRRLGQLECPTLVVRGTHDRFASAAWVEHLARSIPRGRLIEVPGGDHALNFTEPELLGDLIVPFVCGVRAAERSPGPSWAAPGRRHGTAPSRATSPLTG
jgi:2-hydroxy-6-oxonona-2,4-dienedioate hydrolase